MTDTIRKVLHEELDKALNGWDLGERQVPAYGSVTLDAKFEDHRCTLVVRERTMDNRNKR